MEVAGKLTIREVTRPVAATGSVARGHNVLGDEVLGVDVHATVDQRN